MGGVRLLQGLRRTVSSPRLYLPLLLHKVLVPSLASIAGRVHFQKEEESLRYEASASMQGSHEAWLMGGLG